MLPSSSQLLELSPSHNIVSASPASDGHVCSDVSRAIVVASPALYQVRDRRNQHAEIILAKGRKTGAYMRMQNGVAGREDMVKEGKGRVLG